MSWINVNLKFKIIDQDKLRKYLLDEFNLSQPICDLIFDSKEYKDLVYLIEQLNNNFFSTSNEDFNMLNNSIYNFLEEFSDAIFPENIEFLDFNLSPKIRSSKELKLFKEYITNLKEVNLEEYYINYGLYKEIFNKHKNKFHFIGTEYCKPGYLICYEQNKKINYFLIGSEFYKAKASIDSDALVIRVKKVIDMDEVNLDKIFE